MDIFEAIKTRRSIRSYKPIPIPEDLIEKIIEAARFAPSAHNAQPWRFILIKSQETKKKLAIEMAEKWKKDLMKDGFSADVIKRKIESSISRLTNAQLIILACLTMEGMDKYPDKARQEAEYIMGVQSVAAAIQNMLLAAHALGLGCCWMCAPLFAKDVVRNVLGIPDDVEPQALITVGYPDESPLPPERYSIQQIIYLERWGNQP